MTKRPFPARESGAVLIVALLFLVVLTMLGITAMSSTTFEERRAGNARDAAVAFQAAVAGLREARSEVIPLAGIGRGSNFAISTWPTATDNLGSCTPLIAGNTGICRSRQFNPYPNTRGDPLPDIPENVDWSDSTTARYGQFTGSGTLAGLSQQPRYIIELFCPQLAFDLIDGSTNCRVYRFTARGYGRNPNTQVTLQEIFYKESL
jgi:type IV pilus assembly protein PilX